MISSTSSSLSHEEYLRKKRQKKLFRYGLVVFIFISLVALLSYISHRPQIRISKVELFGGVLVTQNEIESMLLSEMSGSYFWLFPKNNSFIYSKDGLEKHLKETFKRIDTINIYRKNLKTLIIEIKERKPVAMWCGDLPSDTEECYFIDQNSTIFAKAPTFSGDAYFKFYGSTRSLQVDFPTSDPIGKEYIASTTEFVEISYFILKTKELLLRPQYLVAKENNEFSLFIADGGEILFDMKIPLVIVVQNLKALLRTPALAFSDEVLPVEYIDLRYGNKLFYKLK